MKTIKKVVVIAALVALSLAVIYVALSRHINCQLAMPTETFENLEDAADEALVETGWLPDFLPSSAREIRVKRHISQHRVHVAFSFATEESEFLIAQAERLPMAALPDVRPYVICRREKWFPRAILAGRHTRLASQGFTLYRRTVELTDQESFHYEWYFLVQPDAGKCYMWRRRIYSRGLEGF